MAEISGYIESSDEESDDNQIPDIVCSDDEGEKCSSSDDNDTEGTGLRKRRSSETRCDDFRNASSSTDASISDAEIAPVLVKTPSKIRRTNVVEPHRDEVINPVIEGKEYQTAESVSDDSESSNFDHLNENTYSSSDSSLTSNNSSSEECGSESDSGGSEVEGTSELPLYPGSAFTCANFDALLLACFKKHRMSEAAKQDFLKLLQLTLPDGNSTATSSYKFNKRHEGCLLPYKLLELCPSCNKKVEREMCCNNECDNEGLTVDPARFFVIPLKPQMQRLIQEYCKEIEEYREQMSIWANGDLRDIQDGRVYQKFILEDPRARGRRIFSIVASSDGAPLIKSKSFSIWPLMCFLVELPPKERYKFENVMLTGLWYGKGKPNVPLFLKRFVDELSDLANGVEFTDDTGQPILSVCRIQSVVPDLPAKSMLFNLKQYNGQFGCSTCKHPGRYDKELRARLYEYTTSDAVSLRTAEETRRHARLAETSGTPVFGIKGQNVFSKLVDIPDNLPIDWMHCVCEGILKRQLFNRWLNRSFAEEQYSLVAFAEVLDEILLSIKVPHDFTRKPRCLADLKYWKASEFRLFVLFTGLPCLRHAVLASEFSVDHFYHFALLSTALRYLHSVPISKARVNTSQVLLDNFVRLLPSLYSRQDCTYNSHALLHFPSQVLDNGPLSFISAFVFEAFIAHLKNLYSGTRGIPKQMVEKLGISQCYKHHVRQNCKDTPNAAKFAQGLLRQDQKTRMTDGGVRLYEPMHYKRLVNYQNVLHASFGSGPDESHLVSYRMTKDHVTFHSTMYPRKGNSCSYLVQFRLHSRIAYGKVVCYIFHQNIAYALLLKYNVTGVDVCQGLSPPQDAVLKEIVHKRLIGQHFAEVQDTERPLIISCNVIVNRCLYVQGKDGKGFITRLDTPYEHD